MDSNAGTEHSSNLKQRRWAKYLIPLGFLPVIIAVIGILTGAISGTPDIIASLDQVIVSPVVLLGIYLVSEKENTKTTAAPYKGDNYGLARVKAPVVLFLVIMPVVLQLMRTSFPGTSMALAVLFLSTGSLVVLSYYTIRVFFGL